MGKYQLVRRLAIGGMAEVFLAKAAGPMGFEKELVVKRILPHLAEDPQFIEMFLAEAKLAARLNHGNVVQIFDFGEQEESYFIAMEYVDGLDLKTLSRRAFQRGTPMSYPLLARIVSLACEGLAYAHALVNPENGQPLGFIHRDISTDNILVSSTGGVKVVDFGIAKAANVGPQTLSGVLKGKLAYMPPEYLLGSPIDSRADIYALGVVLYELIAGRRPFVADTEPQLMQLIIHDNPVDIGALRMDVPLTLVQVLEKALHKNREARYASCRQMQADLERFLFRCGEPVGALQIAELVKTLSTEPDAPPARRSSQELPAVESASAPTASTRPMRSPSTQSITRPLEATLVTPPSSADTMEEDERLAKLVARPRWRIPLMIAAIMLILMGTAIYGFSRDTVKEPPALAESLHSPPAVPQAPEVPPVAPKALEEQLRPPVSVETPPPPVPSESNPAKRPRKRASKSGTASAPASGGVLRSKLAPAFLTLAPMPSGEEVFVFIGDDPVDLPVKKRPMQPGKYEIEVSGTNQGHRFSRVEIVTLKEGESKPVPLNVERLYVGVQGLPPGKKVLKFDAHTLDSKDMIETYEGWHVLRIVDAATGKEEKRVDCLVVVGSVNCMVKLP
ncbi:serine/threonine protein kinase [Hyalangium sp.]|uniref:serine/threonine protein kinase n=1 Tax=Hyalangium sp. TaxID=2028555 RepID=UPI002D250FBB|nr:protein kinase [Hyalangium sp.]HYI01245.1 protein kinase [Hyalangium sp.]